jgi:hypothetical protein
MSEPRELTLLDLAPERPIFRDEAFGGDGARYEYRLATDFGLEDAASLRRVQDELARASSLIVSQSATAEQLEQAAARLSTGFDAFLRLVLPALPAERVKVIPLRGKQVMLEFWRDSHPPAEQEALKLPLAGAARATPRSRRSRGSSPPTV